jgi:hypothetical protein
MMLNNISHLQLVHYMERNLTISGGPNMRMNAIEHARKLMYSGTRDLLSLPSAFWAHNWCFVKFRNGSVPEICGSPVHIFIRIRLKIKDLDEVGSPYTVVGWTARVNKAKVDIHRLAVNRGKSRSRNCKKVQNYGILSIVWTYEGVSKSFRTSRLERELQMVQLSATRCSCIAILWVSVVSFATIILYVACQRVIANVNMYFVTDRVRKLLVTPSSTGRFCDVQLKRFIYWTPFKRKLSIMIY